MDSQRRKHLGRIEGVRQSTETVMERMDRGHKSEIDTGLFTILATRVADIIL